MYLFILKVRFVRTVLFLRAWLMALPPSDPMRLFVRSRLSSLEVGSLRSLHSALPVLLPGREAEV